MPPAIHMCMPPSGVSISLSSATSSRAGGTRKRGNRPKRRAAKRVKGRPNQANSKKANCPYSGAILARIPLATMLGACPTSEIQPPKLAA